MTHKTRLFLNKMTIICKQKFIIVTTYYYFQAMDKCLGDVDVKDGICPDFQCIGPSSCNNRGICGSSTKICDCDPGYSGFDCSIDLDGETLHILHVFLFQITLQMFRADLQTN